MVSALLIGKKTVIVEGWLSAASTKREYNFKSRIYVHRKWNVLSKMVIPRVNLSCQYITSELEEIEREDNFRLKRFKELKIKKQKAKEVPQEKKEVKEVPIIKTIPEECPVCAQETDSSTCSCKSNVETSGKDNVSISSVYKEEEPEIEDDITNTKRIKSIEFIDQRDFSTEPSEKSISRKLSSGSNLKQNICDSCMSKYSSKDSKESKVIKFIDQTDVDNDRVSDKCSVCQRKPSEKKIETKVIDQKISQKDSKILPCQTKPKSIEFIDQRELNRKESNRINTSCQADSNVCQAKDTETEIVCPTCNTKLKTNNKEYSSSCTGLIPETDINKDDDLNVACQNPEANVKSAASTCSCSQLANVKLPSDKDVTSVSFDKCCATSDSKESKLKEEEKKHSCESVCKGDKRNPKEENEGTQKIVESVKEIKIRKLPDKDGNITVEKRIITMTNEKRIAISKCCSESNMYNKPSYAGSNKTIKASKSKMKGKRNQMSIPKPCGSASSEFSKAPCCISVRSDANNTDQDVQNKSNNSTSLSASVASVDYSCSDKTVSACEVCAESTPEETKTTQTSPQTCCSTQTENDKPQSSSYRTIKIFAKADSDVPRDDSNSIELTPSALALLRKILLQASKSCASTESSKPPMTPKCDCSTKSSARNKPQPICSTKPSIPDDLIEGENTQDTLDQTEPEKTLQDKEGTPKKCTCQKTTNKGVQPLSSEPESFEVAGREMKNVSTETISVSPKKNTSEVIKKHTCGIKVDEPKDPIIKKESSVCTCKSKKGADNSELKCSCSKAQGAQKPCTCSKSQSEEDKCKCNKKEETTKPCSCSAPKQPCPCKTPKPKLDPTGQSETPDIARKTEESNDNPTGQSETPDTASKTEDSNDNKICTKCLSTNEASLENTDSPETKDIATQRSFDSISKQSCCSQDKPKPNPKIAASQCSLCGKKDASTSTRRSDRYDVRPLRLLMQYKKAPCPCLSDSAILKNIKPTNTKLRRCSSYR